jgi:hypothetical protein
MTASECENPQKIEKNDEKIWDAVGPPFKQSTHQADGGMDVRQ